jgi:hypothetical protein
MRSLEGCHDNHQLPASREAFFFRQRRHQLSLKCRPRFQLRVELNQKQSPLGTDGKKESNHEK